MIIGVFMVQALTMSNPTGIRPKVAKALEFAKHLFVHETNPRLRPNESHNHYGIGPFLYSGIYGKQAGLNVGLFHEADGRQYGFNLNLINDALGGQRGIGFSLLNFCLNDSSIGVYVSLVGDYGKQTGVTMSLSHDVVGEQRGVHVGLTQKLGEAKGVFIPLLRSRIYGNFTGFLASTFYSAFGTLKGVTVSLVNTIYLSKDSDGLMLGLVNVRMDEEKWYNKYRLGFAICRSEKKAEEPKA